MQTIGKFLSVVALATGLAVGAAENQAFKIVKLQNVKAVGGSYVASTNQAAFMCSNLFKIDPTKKYTLSAQVRTTSGAEKSQIYIGFSPFNAQRRQLISGYCNAFASTFTTLTAAAKKGDVVLKVKDGSQYMNRAWYCLAPYAKADFSDLPNFNIISAAVKAAKQVGDHWELLLSKPLPVDLPAGIGLRQHAHGGYLYTAGGAQVGNQWQTMKGSIQGVAVSGWLDHKWPKGVDQAQIIVFMNFNGKKITTELKDLKLIVE